jgi:SAM-dependent methyltransferase
MMYDRYAAVYDGSGQVRFALLMAPYLADLLRRHPTPARRILDAACGTGSLALILAAEGSTVLGVDRSPAMLEQARTRAASAALAEHVEVREGDIRRLARIVPAGAFDLVTCTYDSLNYMLTEADLAACFHSFAYALADGGLFVGDMNTRFFLEHGWHTCTILEQSGYIQVEQSLFDASCAMVTLALTGFIGDDEQGYERFDEVHAERAYPAETIARLLGEAGLIVEAAYHCFTFNPPGPTTPRIAWVARKGVGETQRGTHPLAPPVQ